MTPPLLIEEDKREGKRGRKKASPYPVLVPYTIDKRVLVCYTLFTLAEGSNGASPPA